MTVFAFDATTNLPKSGDAANLTAYVSKDDGAVTVLGDTSATELDATNAKGFYIFDLTQAETNGDKLLFSGKSATANIVVIAGVIYTTPASFTSFSVNPTLASAQTFNNTGTWTGSLTGSVGTVGGQTLANLDATVSSRMATFTYTAPPSVASIAAQITIDHGSGSYVGGSSITIDNDAIEITG